MSYFSMGDLGAIGFLGDPASDLEDQAGAMEAQGRAVLGTSSDAVGIDLIRQAAAFRASAAQLRAGGNPADSGWISDLGKSLSNTFKPKAATSQGLYTGVKPSMSTGLVAVLGIGGAIFLGILLTGGRKRRSNPRRSSGRRRYCLS